MAPATRSSTRLGTRRRNILWVVLAGWWLALGHILTGCLLCVTIIGIPLGIANFKMAGAALTPFGKEIVSTRDLSRIPAGAVAVDVPPTSSSS